MKPYTIEEIQKMFDEAEKIKEARREAGIPEPMIIDSLDGLQRNLNEEPTPQLKLAISNTELFRKFLDKSTY